MTDVFDALIQAAQQSGLDGIALLLFALEGGMIIWLVFELKATRRKREEDLEKHIETVKKHSKEINDQAAQKAQLTQEHAANMQELVNKNGEYVNQNSVRIETLTQRVEDVLTQSENVAEIETEVMRGITSVTYLLDGLKESQDRAVDAINRLQDRIDRID